MMVETIFLQVNQWLTSGTAIAALGAFIWGMMSILVSPCHLASIPLLVAYVAGQDQQNSSATSYAILFSTGLFLTIALVGIICAMLGRILGDLGPYWALAVGALLLWVAIDMLTGGQCSSQSRLLARMRVKGRFGAFVLGLAYGLLSGACTFAFIAPLLAIVTVQGKLLTGSILIIIFAIGHCLPIALAGNSTSIIKRLLGNKSMDRSFTWIRQGAGIVIGALGCYFLSQPFS